jgi:hypothetical protein
MKGLKFYTLKQLAVVLSILLLVGGIFSYAVAEEAPSTSSLIVKMVAGLSPEEQAALITANGGIETSSILALRLHVIEVPTDQLSTIIQNYQNDTRVVRVEENKERKAEGKPSDTDYLSQWALPKIGWDQVFGTITPTGSATVAVLDTGVDSSHDELAGKLITCASILDGSDCTSDPHGHGTWLAGIVAANTDNNNGIAGVGYNGVKIMPVTVLNADGIGQDSAIIAGVIWAVENGADVILMGFSNPGFSQNLQDAIDYAWENNVVLVASTGNDGISDPTFPAGDRGVIGVSATDISDNLVSFSNYGQDVFLAAPGLDIETTDTSNSFISISGTSSSAAIVAGAAAFMRAVEPGLSNGIVVGRLARNADPAGDPANDFDVQLKFGNGRVNMARALADTSLEEVQPAGAEPVGDGGPYVGPYKVAACALFLNPTSGPIGTGVAVTSGGSCFNASATITIKFDSTAVSTTPSTCTVNNGGNITTPGCTFTVPIAGNGAHTVSATDGSHTPTGTFTITGGCGNSIVDGSEQCDLGSNNGKSGFCCSSTCQFVASGTECRASAGVCDVAETCTGSSALCPTDAKSTAECRGVAGVCDIAESCNGVGNDCPDDAFLPASTECRKSAGVCDIADYCTGSGAACSADAKSTAECRGVAGVCDIAESCDGVGNDCPDDAFLPASTECRASTDSCDPAEYCTGLDVACPTDVFDTCEPIVLNVLATPNPVAAGQPIVITATIDDSGTGNSNIMSADYKIDDGDWTPMNGNFNNPVMNVSTDSLNLPTDVYNICVRGTDIAGNTGDEVCTFLAVYDPSAGFVTGGGWINSPAGAYADNPSLTGKANFGFVSKYKKGANVPTGNTEFQFKAGNLNFHSETYEWLVVSGARAQYKGTGTINGTGNYSFLLTAIDGQVKGGGGVDKFRIKIWDNDGIVYDNKMNFPDTIDDATELGGGSIVIHK